MREDLRYFLKDSIRRTVDFSATAQSRGLPPPPPQKPCPPGAAVIPLPARSQWTAISPISVLEAIAGRESHRAFSPEPLALEELAFLLWATQGLRRPFTGGNTFRTVPSAGCRHALETALAVFRVKGLESGLYRYLPLDHGLVPLPFGGHLEEAVRLAALGQGFVARGAVTFFWTALPERMEWRYGDASYKVIALDAGHVCQNLYLACAAVGAGTCAVGAYDQDVADALLGVDGETEFTIYLAPVGKLPR